MRLVDTIVASLMLCLFTVASAQSLVREEIFESRASESADWQIAFKTIYGYNQKGKWVNLTTYEVSVYTGRFVKKSETNIDYDTWGNQSFRNYVSWQVLPVYKKEYESTTRSTYSAFGLMEQDDYYSDLIQGWTRENKTVLDYNERGQITYRSYENKKDKKLQYGNREHIYYDARGCRLGNSSTTFDGSLNDWYLNDSTYIETDGKCNYVFEKRLSFQPSGFFFTREYKYERVYDNLGREIQVKIYYRDDLQREYSLQYTFETEYNLNGLVSFSSSSDGIFSQRTFFEYNDQGQVTSEITEVKTGPASSWALNTEYKGIYNDDGYLIEDSYKTEFDSTIMEFRIKYFTVLERNEDNIITRSRYSSSIYREQEGDFLEDTFESVYEIRCDGEYITRLDNRGDGSQTRITFDYFDKAPCEQIQEETGHLVVFPNPASEYTILYFNEPIQNGELLLTDAIGNIILHKPLQTGNYFPIELTDYKVGVYILKVVHSSGELSRLISIVK